MNAWTFLFIAGVCEIGWPLGFKLANDFLNLRWGFIAFSVVSMILSGFFLLLAQRHIPIGTAYAVWTGIGAVGTFIVGVFLFKDPMMVSRLLGISLIIAGVMILKFTAV